MVRLNFDVTRLPFGTAQRLMDHDLAVGQRQTFALGTRRQQERTHARRHADADGRHIAFDILHRVVDCHTGGDGTAGAVDIQMNILVGILPLQVDQLRHHQRRGRVVDLVTQHNDPVVQQPGKNIIAALAPAGLLDHIGHQTHIRHNRLTFPFR